MAFVNEYVSEEDIARYQLIPIWLENNPLYRKEGKLPPGYKLEWTIDRERDIYLMEVGGAGYDKDYTDWVLYWRQKPITIYLSNPRGGSDSFDEQPYRIIWALNKIFKNFTGEEERQEFIVILKEALRVYGYGGAWKQAPGITQVLFLF